MHLTIIDDNKDVLEAYKDALSNKFTIAAFDNPDEGLSFVSANHTDAVLLDLHLPGRDGFSVFEDLKKAKDNLPILFLTGDGTLDMKVRGLDLGADDYISKPVEMDELVARIKNKIKISRKEIGVGKVIQMKDLVINLEGHHVTLEGRAVKLTPKEFQLLVVLAQNPNKVIHKEGLISQLWKDVHVEMNNLDTHFSNLRRKLKPFSNNIKTLKNLGYVLRI